MMNAPSKGFGECYRKPVSVAGLDPFGQQVNVAALPVNYQHFRSPIHMESSNFDNGDWNRTPVDHFDPSNTGDRILDHRHSQSLRIAQVRSGKIDHAEYRADDSQE
jgi:hypothetical protein